MHPAGGHHRDRDARQQRVQNEQRGDDLHHRDRRPESQQQAEALHPNGNSGASPVATGPVRFASHFKHHDHPAGWHADRIRAHLAWERHHHAAFVVWTGPLFWPYIYTDLFYYPFWPDAYDDAYWPDVYDDYIDSIYLGDPSLDDADAAPAAAVAREPRRSGRHAGSAGAGICGSDSGITQWPFAGIENGIELTVAQQELLNLLKAAAAQAANGLKESCPHDAALTPTGRLQAMVERLQASLNASHIVHEPLTAFYSSLNDAEKAQFNAIGPNAGPKAGTAAPADACAEPKPGLGSPPVERIADAVHPTDAQHAKLDELGRASGRAAAILQTACPDRVARTPVERLDAMETRLDAMIQAAKAIKPALEDFYGALTDEQKARFNALGQRRGEEM